MENNGFLTVFLKGISQILTQNILSVTMEALTDFCEVEYNGSADMLKKVNKKRLMAVLTVKLLSVIFEKYVITIPE